MNLTKAEWARASGTLSLAALTVIASPFAMADDAGWYVGGNLGQSRAKIDDARITSGMVGGGLTAPSIVDDNRDNGYKLFGGYQINKNFALEGGYYNLGKFGFTATTPAPTAGTLRGDIRLRGLNFDVVGILPFTEKFSAFGRVGLNYSQAQDTFAGTGLIRALNPNPSKNDLNYKVGLGLQYNVTESLGLRAEAERYRINDAVGNKGDVDLISVGLIYRFGGPAPAATPAPLATAPEPVVVAPAPTPKTVVLPPPPPPPPRVQPLPTKVIFSADSLFDFGKATIKPEGKEALDKLSADLNGASYDVIMVTGHTDRIGAHV